MVSGTVHLIFPRLVQELTATFYLSDMSDAENKGKKRQRGTVCASITKMVRRVANMERKAPLSPTVKIVAKRMEQKIYDLDKDFQGYHYSILDLMEEDEDFDGEQVILDEYEEKISNILDCL